MTGNTTAHPAEDHALLPGSQQDGAPEAVSWQPKGATRPRIWPAILKGAQRRCPNCGSPGIFTGYLRLRDACETCGLPASSYRTDDAPPYISLMIVGHIIAPLMLLADAVFGWSGMTQALVWAPIALALVALVLPLSKGAVLAVQWVNGIKG